MQYTPSFFYRLRRVPAGKLYPLNREHYLFYREIILSDFNPPFFFRSPKIFRNFVLIFQKES